MPAPLTSPEALAYFAAMAGAVNFAFANRQMLTHFAREAFADFFGQSPVELGLRLVYLGDTVWGLRRPATPAAAPEPAGPSRASTTSSTSPSSKKSTST